MNYRTALAAIALALGGAFTAGAAQASPMNSALPAVKSEDGIRFLTGGVGQAQSDAIIAQESHYPLTLEFVRAAKPDAEYLADVHVIIRNAAGKTVLDTRSDGPFLLADLPDGHYTVEAIDSGHKKIDRIDIAAARPVHRVFEWN